MSRSIREVLVVLKKSVYCILIILLLVISGCSDTSPPESSPTGKSYEPVSEIERLYHKYFDLTDNQKSELRERGYSEEEIAKLDNQDFKNLAANWKLTDEQILMARQIHPELSDIDISGWTNNQFEQYSITQTNKMYAPTPEQSARLEARGISLDIARQMLKEYHSYDTMLSQPESVLNELKDKIIKSNKERDDFIQYKNEIRAKYKEGQR